MRPWIPMLVALAAGMTLGCSSVEGFETSAPSPSSDSVPELTGATANTPNGVYRCDGERAQRMDVLTGRWHDTGGCAIHGGTASVFHWSDGAWGKGSAVLPGEGMTDKHRLVAGTGSDVWFVSRYTESGSDHTRLFHWDGAWWTELYDWEKFLPAGVVRDAEGGAWVYGQRQVPLAAGAYDLVPKVLHVNATHDRWEEVSLFGETATATGLGGLVVDMHATSDGAIWAVGQRPNIGDGVVMRRMGSVWTETPYHGGVPSSVWAESGLDAWVTTSGVGVFHWDGVAWTNTWHERYGTSGRASVSGWLTDGHHWDGTSWNPPDATFPGGFDATFVLPHPETFGAPNAVELLGIFALGDRASGAIHSELWSYDGARWKKETSALAATLESAGGVLTSVAGTSVSDLWIAPVVPYVP